MTDNILLKIHEELVAIRELLAKQQTAAPAKQSSFFSTPSAAQAEIPQPTELVDNPGDVQVFYGKNNGVALSKLSERSAEWYAQEQPPKMDSSGRPYPERPQERVFKNAARQLYHQRKGSLKTAASLPPKNEAAEKQSEDDGEQIPF